MGVRIQALKARKYGVPYRVGVKVGKAARTERITVPLAFALVEQESGFRHIFGHDTSFLVGEKVTEARYRALQRHVKAGGTSNGVGYTQITYPSYILDHNGLWDEDNNLQFGFRLIRDSIRSYGGEEKGLAVYNGGPSNPQYGYANEVLARKAKWAKRL